MILFLSIGHCGKGLILGNNLSDKEKNKTENTL
jgi:hypothetical protein